MLLGGGKAAYTAGEDEAAEPGTHNGGGRGDGCSEAGSRNGGSDAREGQKGGGGTEKASSALGMEGRLKAWMFMANAVCDVDKKPESRTKSGERRGSTDRSG